MHRHLRLLLVAVVFAAVAVIPSAASASDSHPFELYWGQTPNSWSTNTDANFSINADNADASDLSYTCSLDGAAATTCPQQDNYFDELSDGMHTFTQVATDGDSSESLSFDWVVDGGIGTHIYGKPDKLSDDRWASFYWGTNDAEDSTEVDHVECKFDDADWATCPGNSSERYMSSDGEHTFSVRAVDGDGNTQAYPTTYTWTIDTVAPTITTNLPSVVTSSDFALNIDVDDPTADVQCELNGYPTDCDIDFSTLTDDSNNLAIFATDATGNEGYYYKHFGYQVDASVATITSHPARIKATAGTSTFEFSADAGATIECSFNGDDFEPCTSPVTVHERWTDDDYSFEVRAVKNGVTQSVSDEFDWYVGDHPFDLYFGDNPGGWTSDTSANFHVYADDWDSQDLTYTCSLDGSAFAACDREFFYDNLAPGTHAVVLHATSKTAGGLESLSYDWRISDLPGAWIDSMPDKFTDSTDANFFWGYSANATGWDCKLDDADWSACDHDYYQYMSNLAEGEHTFQVRAHDNDENVQDPPSSYTWTVDQTAPVVTATVPTGPITTDPYTIPISSNEEGVKVYCVLDDQDWDEGFQCDNGAALSGLSRGTHTISMYGYDRAYNQSDVETYTFDWEPVAATKPAAPVVTPPAPPAKPTVNKPGKPKSGKFTVPYACGDTSCTLTVTFKLGKKTQGLTKVVGKGAGKAQFKLSKSQKKWLGKKGKKKATLTVTIKGASGSQSQSMKF